jgi:uncharacterized sulfatase
VNRIALTLTLLCPAYVFGAAEKLNVVLIIADDLRCELGCYGVPAVKSPNIDRLAARGVKFDRAYVQYPVCNPSRSSFLTGLRPDATHVLNNTTKLRDNLPDVVTMPQYFRQHGYFTASLGKVFHRGQTMEQTNAAMDDAPSWDVAKYFSATKTGLQGEGRNLTGGKMEWCRWLAAEGDDIDQPDGQVAAAAVGILEEHRDGPFFLAVGFHKPHDPFIAPRPFFDLYPLDQLKLHKDPPDMSPTLPLAIIGDWRNVFAQWTERDKREMKRAYHAGTSFTDAQVGKLLDALDRLRLSANTVVIFIGDHGYHLGEREWWNKNTLFEYSCRAPMIVVAPETKSAGKASPRTVEFVDIYPTLLDLCGLDRPSGLAGRSLRPLLDSPEAPLSKPAFTQVQRGKVAGRTVRTERWRYTEWDDGKQGVELYDHDNDPGEWHNLADNPNSAPTIAQLKPLLHHE